MSSHKDPKVNDDFAKWAQRKYGTLKAVKIHRGKIHEFLGMTMDFSVAGECHIRQEEHIKELVSEWPEIIKKKKKVLTPASTDLFDQGGGGLLSVDNAKKFHCIVAKALFIANRSRPDIAPTVSVLSGRVRSPTKSDWKKCERLVGYLNSTKNLHLVLRYDDVAIARWHVDAAYAVHPDFKSHTGGTLLLSDVGGTIASTSTKQKLNTRSSTEAELVATDDVLSKILWVRLFLGDQGIPLKENLLAQDNKSAILLEENGRASAGK